MNQREKELYLREYSILKAEGKPFFPYAIAKDSLMGCVVMAIIITLSIVLGVALGPKADPTTTTYVARPDWYFFFLFELLRVIKTPSLTPLATVGVPGICMVLLFLLPFYDRSPERRPERRPVATVAGIFTIIAMAFLTYQGAHAGSPNKVEMPPPKTITSAAGLAQFDRGKLVAAQSGCLACHKIGESGNDGPGPQLTHIADKLPPDAIAQTLRNPTTPMPPFKRLAAEQPDKFRDLVAFLGELH